MSTLILNECQENVIVVGNIITTVSKHNARLMNKKRVAKINKHFINFSSLFFSICVTFKPFVGYSMEVTGGGSEDSTDDSFSQFVLPLDFSTQRES